MKTSRAQAHSKVHRLPTLRFSDDRRLTSYAGLVIFQALFQRLGLKDRLRRCFAHVFGGRIIGLHNIFLLLLVHLLLGFRRLRGIDVYRDDPLVTRVVGLRRLPDVSTVSRTLAASDDRCVAAVRDLMRSDVGRRLLAEHFSRITLDFDGTVQSTTGHAEGTAVGYNRTKKGARSYYPLTCTIGQTGQFFDMLHRPGNVHDSNGAREFMASRIDDVRMVAPGAMLESRMDSAFFDEKTFDMLDGRRVAFSCSVPFERLPNLKVLICGQRNWRRINGIWSFFEANWKPKSWTRQYRVVCYRQLKRKQYKGPVQLDLFYPVDVEYEYTAIVTNRRISAAALLEFHHGRGEQEKTFGQGKQHVALDLIATRRLHGNQLFTLAGMYAHNLSRELQMRAAPRQGRLHRNRTSQWEFQELGTIRQRLLHRAGLITHPQGELTLTVNAAPVVQRELSRLLDAASAPS